MRTLYIDTHYLDVHIILFENGIIIKRKDIINVKNNSEFIMPSIKEVCSPNEIDELIVINGPGSFTGVRLGVTIAKTLAYSLNKPIKVLSYFDVLYASNDCKDGIYSLSDNNGYYINEYKNGKSLDNFKYLSNTEYNEYVKTNTVYTNVEIFSEKVFDYSRKFKDINPHLVNPLYIKLIGAQK